MRTSDFIKTMRREIEDWPGVKMREGPYGRHAKMILSYGDV